MSLCSAEFAPSRTQPQRRARAARCAEGASMLWTGWRVGETTCLGPLAAAWRGRWRGSHRAFSAAAAADAAAASTGSAPRDGEEPAEDTATAESRVDDEKSRASPASGANTGDVVTYTSNRTLKIQLMGVFTLAQAIFWGYLHFETTFHPEVLQLPKWMIPVGGLFVVLSSFGTHFMAKTSVAYAALTKGGTHAKLSTFKMTGRVNEPVEVPVALISNEELADYYRMKIGESKSALLIDKAGTIEDEEKFRQLINGRTVLAVQRSKRTVGRGRAGKAAAAARDAEVPEMEWLEAKDPVSGRTYYYHPISRETSWVKPDGASK